MMKRRPTVWLALFMLLLVDHSSAQMNQKEKDQVNAGIAGGKAVVDFLAALGDPKTQKTFETLGKMASFLGATGGLISFAMLFIPQQDSAELKYMKEKFSEVNGKLDIITTELDNVKELITYENQRAVYLGAASKILFGHKQLNAFINLVHATSCSSIRDCRQKRDEIASRYVQDFNVQQHIFKILHGATSQTSAFGDPLLGVVKKTFKCNVGKLDHFSSSILKLAFKAQQVILAYEKLIGSKESITQSMDDWLKSIYDLRDKTSAEKQDCYNNMQSYMFTDIKNKKYQVSVSSNDQANKELKKVLDERYPWLGWVTYSYGAFGGKKHQVQCTFGAFWNIPDALDDRKRNILAIPIDKSGTYSNQKYKVLNAIDDIVANGNFYKVMYDSAKLLPLVEKGLKKNGVWKYVAVLNVLRKYDNLVSRSDNDLYFLSEEYELVGWYWQDGEKKYSYEKVRLLIVLKSTEVADGLVCSKTCSNQGTCMFPPYSSEKICKCKAYHQGDDCEENSKVQLAKTVDAMLETTSKLPVLSDISYDIKDLREYLGVNIGRVQKGVSELSEDMKQSFDKLSQNLGSSFEWTNLVTAYSTSVQKIRYYIERFKNLPKHYSQDMDTEGKKLATSVLAAEGIEKWLYEINFLFLGRKGVPLLNHEPLMLVFMDKYQSAACSSQYKTAVGNAWDQMVLLQQMGYMLWAQALDFMDKPTGHLEGLYSSRTAAQAKAYAQKTCQYSVPNSVNIQCSGGNYIHPKIKITNQCVANYYVTGTRDTTCASKTSGCSACNCFSTGSTSSECADLTGQCYCRAGFSGKRCENRDCVWNAWSGYSQCTKNCNYGGKMTKTRYHRLIKYGSGAACTGSSSETADCFKGCCSGQYHCSKKRKCIPGSYKCDYDDDCSDNQDELDCDEYCFTKYTGWDSHGDGKSVYMDRHRLDCGGNGHVMKMFHLERSGDNIRFQFKCCRMNKILCANQLQYTSFNADGDGDTVYLDRHHIDCGTHGYVNYFRLQRNSAHDKVRYAYYCCHLSQTKHKTRSSCYTSYTSFTDDGDGKNYYLSRQTVQCNARYFLTFFRLNRDSGHNNWRFQYRCCRITS